MKNTICLRIVAIFGFFAVLLGAFGAHGLKKILEENGRIETWQTAVEYHFYHALVLLFLCLVPKVHKATFLSFTSGIVIFSGTLYILSITNIKWLGAITPIGGVLLMIGWLLILLKTSQILVAPQE